MTSPCCEPDTASSRRVCPSCGGRAQPVDRLTVQALLEPRALARLGPGSSSFCVTPTCDVVYFSGDESYATSDLRVPVWQKQPAGGRTICYCFGENEADIRREIETTGESHVVARVRAHIAAGRCACEVRNPRGSCCLGDVAAAVQRLRSEASSPVPR